MSRPYLIYTHDYRRNSAGIRALHQLCHDLNMAGQQAFVMPGDVNEDLTTPIANPDVVLSIGRDGIVVYPEVEDGNPLNARHPARFVLNIPGRIREAEFTKGERTFAYCGLLTKYLDRVDGLLTVPVVDRGVFQENLTGERWPSVTALWIGKGTPGMCAAPGFFVHITHDWPDSWSVLAGIFQRVDRFYSYQPYSALTIEARLCGCPTVVIPNEYWTREEFAAGTPGGMNGLAWGTDPDELQRARGTVHLFADDYNALTRRYSQQLYDFIRITQEDCA